MDWDNRYRQSAEYLFGTAPASFVVAEAHRLKPGSRVLCLADGEGRNSVYLAGLGHQVTAVEQSAVALGRARALAEKAGVTVDFRQGDLAKEDWAGEDWALGRFDAVLGVFIQFAPSALRRKLHAQIAKVVDAGGLVMLHGYALRQPAFATGGPKDPDHLYSVADLAADFPGWRLEQSADYDTEISEGSAHQGMSALVDFIARKPLATG